MKYLIASDIHGSAHYTKQLLLAFEKERADKLILLGDIYSHGPRNALPKEYSPMEVSALLNAVKDRLIVIKGNCDSQVDEMISDFDFIKGVCLNFGDKTAYLTHGHEYNKDKPTKTKFDLVIYGHFHVGEIENKDGTVYICVGSVALPKNQSPRSYLTIENGEIILKSLDGEIINQIKI